MSVDTSVLQYDTVHEIVLTLPVPAFVKDRSSRFVVCNEALADFIKVDQSDMIGKTDADMLGTDDRAATYRSWDRRVIETGDSVLNLVESVKTLAGSLHSVETNKFPLQNAQGAVVGVFGHFSEHGRQPGESEPEVQPQSTAVIEDIVLRYLSAESFHRSRNPSGFRHRRFTGVAVVNEQKRRSVPEIRMIATIPDTQSNSDWRTAASILSGQIRMIATIWNAHRRFCPIDTATPTTGVAEVQRGDGPTSDSFRIGPYTYTGLCGRGDGSATV